MKQKLFLILALVFLVSPINNANDLIVIFPIPEQIIDNAKKLSKTLDNSYADKISNELDVIAKSNDSNELAKLAVLYDYYIGESNAEDLDMYVIAKGDAILPYLVFKVESENDCLRRFGKSPICLPDETSKVRLKKQISRIRAGVTVPYRCEEMKNIIDFDLKNIELAINQYKSVTGKYPVSLQQLQDFIQLKYRTNLRIYDPCWYLYKYVLGENNTYTLSLDPKHEISL